MRAPYTVWFPGEAGGILVVVNDWQDRAALAATLVDLHREEPVTRIHLLATREPPTPYARRHLRSLDVMRVLRESAAADVAPLGTLLDRAGVPHQRHIKVGPWIETIVDVASEHGGRRILVGDNRASLAKNLLLRHDRALLQGHVARTGLLCRVICRDESTPANAVRHEAAT